MELYTSSLYSDANLQGYWRLEADGTDSSSNGYNLTASGSPSYTIGMFGNGVDLELSSSQYFSIADASCPDLDITGDIAISMWVKLEQLPSTAGTAMTLASKDPVIAGDRGWFFDILNTTNQLRFNYDDASNNRTRSVSNFVFSANDVGNWVHIAVSVDVSAHAITYYINGVADAGTYSNTAATSIKNVSTPFYIGATHNNGSPTSFFDGIIDDVAIWDRALTDVEVGYLYSSVYHVSSTTNGAASGTDITCTAPSGIASGDILICAIHNNGVRTVSDNNGATPFTGALVDRTYNGPSATMHILYRVAGASEPGSYSFTASASDRWSIIISAYRGGDPAVWDVAPSATTENTGTGSSNTTDALTTLTDGAMIVAIAGNDSNTLTFTGTPSDGFSSRQNNSGEELLALADKQMPVAGLQNAVTWTQSTSNGTWLNNIFSIKPLASNNRSGSLLLMGVGN